ncbi:hypothetical protein CF326_g5500 [Tilletia indica]|nr:hypothetical protein CF326_g5500 [Tilletia indica]
MESSPPESPTISRTPFNTVRLEDQDPEYARARRDRALQIEALSIALGQQLGNSAEVRNIQRPAGAGTPAGPMSPPPGRISPSGRLPYSLSATPRPDAGEGFPSLDGLGPVSLPWLWSDAELFTGFATAMPSSATPPMRMSVGGAGAGQGTGAGTSTGRNSPVATRAGLPPPPTLNTTAGMGGSSSSERRHGHGRGGIASSSLSQSQSRFGSLSRMPNTRGAFVNGVWHPDGNSTGGGATQTSLLDEGGFFRRPSLSRSSSSSIPEAFVHNPSAPIPGASSRGQTTPQIDGGSTLQFSRVDGAPSEGIGASRSPAGSNRGHMGTADDGTTGDAGGERRIVQGTVQSDVHGQGAGASVVHLSFEVVSGPDLRVAVRKVQKWKDQVAEIEAAIPPEELPPPRLFSFSCRARKSAPVPADSDLPKSATRMLLRLYYSTIRPPDSSMVWYLPLFIIVLAWAIVILATAGRTLADARRLSPAAAFVPLAVMAGSVCIALGLLYLSLQAVRQPAQDVGDDESVDDHGRSVENTGPRRIRTRARSQSGTKNGPTSETDQASVGGMEGRRKPAQRRRVLVGKSKGVGSESPRKASGTWSRSRMPKSKTASATYHPTAPTSRISISAPRWSLSGARRGGVSDSGHRSRGASITAGPLVAERRSRTHGTPLPPPTIPPPPTPAGPSPVQTRTQSRDHSRAHSPVKPPPRPTHSPSPTRTPRPSSSLGQHGGRLTVVSPTPPPAGSHSHSRHSMASAPLEGPLAEEDEGTGEPSGLRGPSLSGRVGGLELGRGQSPSHPPFTTMLHAQPSMDELNMRERHRAPGGSRGKGSHQLAGQLQPNLLNSHSHSASSSASSLASSASWPPSKREISAHISSMVRGSPSPAQMGSNELWVSRAGGHLSRRSQVRTIQAVTDEAERSAAEANDVVTMTPVQSRQGAQESAVLLSVAGTTHDLGTVSPGQTPRLGPSSSNQTMRQENWGSSGVRRQPSGRQRVGYGGPLGLNEEAMASLDIDRSQAPATWSYSSAPAIAASCSSLSRPRSDSGSGFAPPDNSPPKTRSQSRRSGSSGSVRPRIADFRAHQAARRQYVLDVLDGRLPIALEGGSTMEGSPNSLFRSQSMSALRASWSRLSSNVLPTVKGSGDSRWTTTRDDDLDGDMAGPSQGPIGLDPRLPSPLRLRGLPLNLDLDADDSDEVDIQPVPAIQRLGLGVSSSDGNRSSGDTPDGHAARQSRDGRRPSSSLSSVYSPPATRRALAMQFGIKSSDVFSPGGTTDDVQGKGRMARHSRDRSMSESASASRRRDRTSPIAEDALQSTYDEPWRNNVVRERPASTDSDLSSRRANSFGAKAARRGRGASVSGTTHQSHPLSPALPDLRGLGISTTNGAFLTRPPVELPRLQAPGPSLILHSPSGGAAGTGFPYRTPGGFQGGAGSVSAIGTGRLPDETPRTTETRSTFKFLRLEGPEDEAYVEKLSQRAEDGALTGDSALSRRVSPQHGGLGAGVSPAGSFGRRLGLALRLGINEADGGGPTLGGGAEIYRHASSAGGTAALPPSKPVKKQPRLGFMSRTPEPQRWVIIRDLTTTVVPSSSELGQDRGGRFGADGTGLDKTKSTRKTGDPHSPLGGRIRPIASVAAHPLVLVLTLAVNVLTIGMLGAGMALSALLLQAAPALGSLATTTSSSSRFVLLKASELSIGRGGAIFGLALGAILSLTILARLSCLVTQVISWRARQRKRRRRTRRRVAAALSTASGLSGVGLPRVSGAGVSGIGHGTAEGGDKMATRGSGGVLADRAGESGLEAQERRRRPGEEETADDTEDSWELV